MSSGTSWPMATTNGQTKADFFKWLQTARLKPVTEAAVQDQALNTHWLNYHNSDICRRCFQYSEKLLKI